MTTADSDVLWTIFSFIGTNWGTAANCDMSQQQFDLAVSLQIQRDPTYAGYYGEAIAEYANLLNFYSGNQQAALMQLFTENELGSPKLPDVATYVLLEFMRWNVAFGGFRSFNYVNYSGWMGGGSYLTVPPPYRALPVSARVERPAGQGAKPNVMQGVRHG